MKMNSKQSKILLGNKFYNRNKYKRFNKSMSCTVITDYKLKCRKILEYRVPIAFPGFHLKIPLSKNVLGSFFLHSQSPVVTRWRGFYTRLFFRHPHFSSVRIFHFAPAEARRKDKAFRRFSWQRVRQLGENWIDSGSEWEVVPSSPAGKKKEENNHGQKSTKKSFTLLALRQILRYTV